MTLLQASLQEKSIVIGSGDRGSHTINLYVYSTFPDMSHSTTAEQPPHRALQLRRDEITTAASQLEAYIQAASAKQFQQNHNIVWQ
jgi:hypothetical protein